MDKTQTVTANDLIAFVREKGDLALKTERFGREFRVRAAVDGIEYIPASTAGVRTHPRKWLERFCEEFSRTNSFKTSSYQSITVNASYGLALIREYLRHKNAG